MARGYLDRILPAGTTRDLFEENLEILGHLIFALLVVLSFRVIRAGIANRSPAPGTLGYAELET